MKFETIKFDKKPFIYLFIIIGFYFVSAIYNITEVDFGLIVFILAMVIFSSSSIFLTVSYNNILFSEKDLKLNNSRKNGEDTLSIEYSNIVEIQIDSTYSHTILIVTRDEQYILYSSFDNIVELFKRLKNLESFGVKVDDRIFSRMIKNYIQGTRFGRQSMIISLIFIGLFNIAFFNINAFIWFFFIIFQFAFMFYINIFESIIMSKKVLKKNFESIEKKITTLNRTPFILTTILFIAQILIIIFSII